ncbi:MAG: LysR family transcriptional regulator [Polyangiales bacterium]
MLDWNDLRFLLAVARARTLTAAARALRVSQPTVSRRLAALEHAFGARLFLRGAEGYALTAAGRRLLDAVEPLAQQLERVERSGVEEASAVAGVVRVAVTEMTAVHLVDDALGPLLAAHPALTVDLVADNQASDLARGEADLAVRLLRPDAADLVRRRLGAMRFGLFASPAYLARAPAVTAPGLAGHHIVKPVRSLGRGPEAAWIEQHATRAAVSVCADGAQVAMRAAAAGLGLAVLSDALAANAPALVCARALAEIPPREVWLVYHRDLRALARVKRVAEAIDAHLRARLLRSRAVLDVAASA